jgi:hypothetical protein
VNIEALSLHLLKEGVALRLVLPSILQSGYLTLLSRHTIFLQNKKNKKKTQPSTSSLNSLLFQWTHNACTAKTKVSELG